MMKCMQTMGHTNGVCVNETIVCNYKITNTTNVLVPSAINVDIGIVERHINPIIDINWSWRYPYYAPQFHMYVRLAIIRHELLCRRFWYMFNT